MLFSYLTLKRSSGWRTARRRRMPRTRRWPENLWRHLENREPLPSLDSAPASPLSTPPSGFLRWRIPIRWLRLIRSASACSGFCASPLSVETSPPNPERAHRRFCFSSWIRDFLWRIVACRTPTFRSNQVSDFFPAWTKGGRLKWSTQTRPDSKCPGDSRN